MAKGKHRPAPGALRPDKVLHPQSRKVKKLHKKEVRKAKLSASNGVGGQRLQILGEKLLWFQDNMYAYLEEENVQGGHQRGFSEASLLALTEAYLGRFQDELEQIELKNSVGLGGIKGKRNHHLARKDAISMTLEAEKVDFEGCGLEIPDLLDQENLNYLKDWNGELRFVQNIKLRRFHRKQLMSATVDNKMDDGE